MGQLINFYAGDAEGVGRAFAQHDYPPGSATIPFPRGLLTPPVSHRSRPSHRGGTEDRRLWTNFPSGFTGKTGRPRRRGLRRRSRFAGLGRDDGRGARSERRVFDIGLDTRGCGRAQRTRTHANGRHEKGSAGSSDTLSGSPSSDSSRHTHLVLVSIGVHTGESAIRRPAAGFSRLRLALSMVVVFLILHGSATAFGSLRGEAGIAVAVLVVLGVRDRSARSLGSARGRRRSDAWSRSPNHAIALDRDRRQRTLAPHPPRVRYLYPRTSDAVSVRAGSANDLGPSTRTLRHAERGQGRRDVRLADLLSHGVARFLRVLPWLAFAFRVPAGPNP